MRIWYIVSYTEAKNPHENMVRTLGDNTQSMEAALELARELKAEADDRIVTVTRYTSEEAIVKS